jgi:hypothetical protein
MSLRNAAEMALEALEGVVKNCWRDVPGWRLDEIKEQTVVLRAALAEAGEPPRREPLTEEKIKAVRRELAAQALLISTAECKRVVRVIERAHGIGDSDE